MYMLACSCIYIQIVLFLMTISMVILMSIIFRQNRIYVDQYHLPRAWVQQLTLQLVRVMTSA